MFGTGALCRSALAVLKLDEEKLHSLEDIKAAFHRQAKKVHPDVGGSAQAFRELHDAYRYLHDAINERPTDAISNFCGRCGERREKSTHNYGFQGKSGSADEEDFSASENANYSTRDFYRPYVFHQFAHGFTHGEVHEANLRNYRHVFYLITKHMLLCGGLACLFIAYMKENRIQRAIDARNGGYLDISYWEKLRSDVWSRIVPPISSSWATNGNNELRRAWNCHLRRTQGSAEPLRQQTVISFCGRPFTAAGVRGARGTTPKPTATYEDDGHFELDDVASL
ncbi:hypothetical protein TRVL_07148 [Trypanosoma vivax]|nr:hypothetical protein TRVL_07148 [Trypanosoma vivax]